MLKTSRGKINISDGDMTFLGKVMALMPLDVHLSKLIVLGYMFSVLQDTIIMGMLKVFTYFRTFQYFINFCPCYECIILFLATWKSVKDCWKQTKLHQNIFFRIQMLIMYHNRIVPKFELLGHISIFEKKNKSVLV